MEFALSHTGAGNVADRDIIAAVEVVDDAYDIDGDNGEIDKTTTMTTTPATVTTTMKRKMTTTLATTIHEALHAHKATLFSTLTIYIRDVYVYSAISLALH